MALNFKDVSILTIGDVMLDRYFIGKVDRISPEAPVPIVNVKTIKDVPGGAANVSNNISHLLAKSYLIGRVGDDENSERLKELCDSNNILHNFHSSNLPTITKIRVIGEHQQIVRIDFEDVKSLELESSKGIFQKLEQAFQFAHLIVISDYGKGFCTKELCQKVIFLAGDKVKVLVDPKGTNWDKYSGAYMITPNLKELGEICKQNIPNDDSAIEKNAKEIIHTYNVKYLLVTRSEKGMSLISPNETFHIPTEAKEVYDVSGAGDTVIGTLAVALGSGMSIIDSIKLANKAAGIVVSKLGTVPITHQELL